MCRAGYVRLSAPRACLAATKPDAASFSMAASRREVSGIRLQATIE